MPTECWCCGELTDPLVLDGTYYHCLRCEVKWTRLQFRQTERPIVERSHP
jgi:hypothetical protein